MAPGLRERKKRATRQALALAALRLAVERGFEQVLVQDIAAAADVSPRTFNNYFASKAEAICALSVDRAQRVGDGLRARAEGEPLWSAVTAVVLDVFAEDAPAPDRARLEGLRVVLSAPALQGELLRVQDTMRQAVADVVAARAAPGADDMFPMVFAGAVAAACDAAGHRWLWAEPPLPLTWLLRRALHQLGTLGDALHTPLTGRPVTADAD